MSFLRPTLRGAHDYQPSEGSQVDPEIFVREIVQVSFGRDLWIFGERRYTGPQQSTAYNSVAVQVCNFPFYAYVDLGLHVDIPTVQAVIKQLNKELRGSIQRWDIVEVRKILGFDYEAFKHSGYKHPHRRMVKIFLKDASQVKKLLHDVEQKTYRDHRNIEHRIKVYNAEWEWRDLLLHSCAFSLQSWVKLKRGALHRTPRASLRSHCQEEYTLQYSDNQVITQIQDRDIQPYLCMTLRTRVVGGDSIESGKPVGATCDSEDLVALQRDCLTNVCADVYWSDGSCPQILRLDFDLEKDFRDKNPSVSDRFLDLPPLEGSESTPVHVTKRIFTTEKEMLEAFSQTVRIIRPGVLITLEDMSPDLAHILLRGASISMLRYQNTHIYQMRPGVFSYTLLGISLIALSEHIPKIRLTPPLAGYGLIDIKSPHKCPGPECRLPHICRGPETPHLDHHNAYAGAFCSPKRRAAECAIEAAIIREFDQGINLVTDISAQSKVTSCPISDVGTGQQIRVIHRIWRTCAQSDPPFVINRERSRLPFFTWPSSAKNSFPLPPELPNVTLDKRGHSFYEDWLIAAIESDRMGVQGPVRQIQPPPDPQQLIQTITSTSIVNPDTDEKKSTTAPTKKKVQLDLMGRPIMTSSSASKRRTGRVENSAKKLKTGATTSKKTGKYQGGFVHDPIAAFYGNPNQPVAVLDFASLYPSIIQAFGICYCLLLADRETAEEAANDPHLTVQYIEIDTGESVCFVTHVNGKTIPTVLPVMERDLVAERKRVKALMKIAGNRVKQLAAEVKMMDKPSLHLVQTWMQIPEKQCFENQLKQLKQEIINYLNYDKQQLGCKVTQNAVYGFTGAIRSAKLPCLPLMASVTAIGRWMNLLSTWYVRRYYLACVVYGDTDSIMIQIPELPGLTAENRMQAYWDKSRQISTELSHLFPDPNDMELENLSLQFLLIKKKMYAYLKVGGPQDKGVIKISGLPIVKRDCPKFIQDIGLRIVHFIIHDKTGDIVPFMESRLSSLARGKVPLEELSVSCSIKQASEYAGGEDANLIQLKLASKIEQRSGIRPVPGSRITYVIVKKHGAPHCECGETLEFAQEHGVQVDIDYYLRTLESSLRGLLMHHQHVVPMQRLVARARSEAANYSSEKDGTSLRFWFSTADTSASATASSASSASATATSAAATAVARPIDQASRETKVDDDLMLLHYEVEDSDEEG